MFVLLLLVAIAMSWVTAQLKRLHDRRQARAWVDYYSSEGEHGTMLFTTWVKAQAPFETIYEPQHKVGAFEALDSQKRQRIELFLGLEITSFEILDGFGARFEQAGDAPETTWKVFKTEHGARAWLRTAKRELKPAPSLPYAAP